MLFVHIFYSVQGKLEKRKLINIKVKNIVIKNPLVV